MLCTNDGGKYHGADAGVVLVLQEGHGAGLIPEGVSILLVLQYMDRLEHPNVFRQGLVRSRDSVGVGSGHVSSDLAVQDGLVFGVEELVVLLEVVEGIFGCAAAPTSVAVLGAAPVARLGLERRKERSN